MTEFQYATALSASALPLVTLHYTWPCKWQGKWGFNCSVESIVALGGPFESEDEAIAAILRTGRWVQRPGRPDHFDAK